MHVYILDENMPSTVPSWLNEKFIHVLDVSKKFSDGEIWEYAFANNLIIVTKDVDFYNRYLSSSNYPKVIWFRTGNMRKKVFYNFIEQIWFEIEIMIQSCSFVVVTEDKLEAL